MPTVAAFDSKEYKRTKEGIIKFYTPFGCGIRVSKPEEFVSRYIESLDQLFQDFNIEPVCSCFPSSEYFKKVGLPKTFRLSDELLKSIKDLIDSVYFSYMVFPFKDIPKVEVGGYKCPKKSMNTLDFLRKTSNHYSYITAWSYLGLESRASDLILIDSFSGKRTPAWDDILLKTNPIIYPHGDECNPFISTADMIASLVDKKMWDNYLRLEPDNLRKVLSSYSFKVDVNFIDPRGLYKIRWVSDEQLDPSPFWVKPTIFLKTDSYNTADIKKLPIYPEATYLARKINAGVQGFDKSIDSSKIKNGDIFVYAGKEAETLAITLQDMYDIKILAFKELKEKMKTL